MTDRPVQPAPAASLAAKDRPDLLHLKVNEVKTAVAVAAGRKFLGYPLWCAREGQVKRAVAAKAKETFKQRIRQLTRLSGGRSLPEWPSS